MIQVAQQVLSADADDILRVILVVDPEHVHAILLRPWSVIGADVGAFPDVHCREEAGAMNPGSGAVDKLFEFTVLDAFHLEIPA